MSYDLESNNSQTTNKSIDEKDINQIINKEIEESKKLGLYVNVTKIMKKIDEELEKQKRVDTNAIDKYNEEYYNDVLLFLNSLFEGRSKSILSLRIKKLIFTKENVAMYNGIIKKHKLECPLFELKNFDFNNNTNINFTVKIIKIIVNNLLKPLDYVLNVTKYKIGTEQHYKLQLAKATS